MNFNNGAFLGESPWSPTAATPLNFNQSAMTPGGGSMDWLFGNGTKDSPGNFGSIVGAAGSLAQLFMGMKQYGLAKDTLNENKRQFGLQYDANKGLTNGRLEDRQRARIGSSGGTSANYQSVGDYMNQHGVK